MSIAKYSIPTKYRGITFRSKLEANWAEFFDDYGISWVYETVGYELPFQIGNYKHSDDTIKYLPDFYLPDLESFFEVKGVMEDLDIIKLLSLWKTFGSQYDQWKVKNKYRVLVGGLRVGLEIIGLSNLWEEFSDTHLGCRFVDFSLVQCKYETIRRKACKKYYFVCPRGVWSCPYCGGEGDGIEPKNQNLEVDEAIEYAEKLNCFLDELEESIVQDDAMSSHPNGTTEEKLKEWHEKFAYYPKE